MADNLAIIQRVIAEHRVMRGDIRLVGESINDMEAVFSLQKVYSGWTQGSAEALTQKRDKLLQTMNFLGDGLKNHFAFEEKALPPILGEVLMQALMLEHREILEELGAAKSMVAKIPLAGAGQEELLTEKSHTQYVVSAVCQKSEEHAHREEVILNMVQKALEEKKG